MTIQKKENKERKHEKYQSLSLKGLHLFHCQTQMETQQIKDREDTQRLIEIDTEERLKIFSKKNRLVGITGWTNRHTDI